MGWLRAIGAPDYKAYLIHHARRHPGTAPMAEREYVNMFIERRFDGRNAGRCC
ncbi:YbdD/YjiX family protein [Bradyrhizobium barranii]